MRWFKRLPSGLGVFVAITLVAPLLALTVLGIRAASQSPLESASKPEPLIGTVEHGDRDRQVSVAIKVEYADALSPAASASGTFTTVNVDAGQDVTTGTVLATVDNTPVIAYASATPLWRDLARGATGADVTVAQNFLKAEGFYAGKADGTVAYSTEKAIKAFNKGKGFGTNNPVLGLASLSWIGPGDVTVAAVSVHAGNACAPGTVLFTTTAALAAIDVTETPNVPRDADILLTVSGITTPYVAGSGRVTVPDFVQKVAAALGPQTTDGVGTVALAQPVVVAWVPSSALVVDQQGRTCFFSGLTGPGTIVEPQGGTIGQVDLDPSFIGQPLLINPREVREDLSCG